jgi:hypothetical protein
MGSLRAAEMAERLPIRQALAWHLRSNHYPPVPLSMVPVCIEAIKACNDGDWERPVKLPAGISFRGESEAWAGEIAKAHHLDAWIGGENE